jgi:hypothetical protein
MAITVEDGSIVTSANSYASEAELTAYALAREVTLTSGEETLLIQAMDYIESLAFIGVKYTDAQALQWPRSGAVVDGFDVAITAIPTQLPIAQMVVALAIDAGNGPLIDLPRKVEREKVGDLEVQYSSGSASVTIARTINAQLWKLLANAGGFKVAKA